MSLTGSVLDSTCTASCLRVCASRPAAVQEVEPAACVVGHMAALAEFILFSPVFSYYFEVGQENRYNTLPPLDKCLAVNFLMFCYPGLNHAK